MKVSCVEQFLAFHLCCFD